MAAAARRLFTRPAWAAVQLRPHAPLQASIPCTATASSGLAGSRQVCVFAQMACLLADWLAGLLANATSQPDLPRLFRRHALLIRNCFARRRWRLGRSCPSCAGPPKKPTKVGLGGRWFWPDASAGGQGLSQWPPPPHSSCARRRTQLGRRQKPCAVPYNASCPFITTTPILILISPVSVNRPAPPSPPPKIQPPLAELASSCNYLHISSTLIASLAADSYALLLKRHIRKRNTRQLATGNIIACPHSTTERKHTLIHTRSQALRTIRSSTYNPADTGANFSL